MSDKQLVERAAEITMDKELMMKIFEQVKDNPVLYKEIIVEDNKQRSPSAFTELVRSGEIPKILETIFNGFHTSQKTDATPRYWLAGLTIVGVIALGSVAAFTGASMDPSAGVILGGVIGYVLGKENN